MKLQQFKKILEIKIFGKEYITFLRDLLMKQEIQLIEDTEKMNQLNHNLGQENKISHQKRDEIFILANQYEAQKEQIQKQREEINHELEPANPYSHKAKEVLGQIDYKDIVELKNGKKPLEIMRYISDTVLILCQAPLIPVQIEEHIFNRIEGKAVLFLKESWSESGSNYLGDMNFLKNLKEYDKQRINDETIELLEPYLNQQDDWFNETYATKASKAFSYIIQWVFAIYQYYQIYKTIKAKYCQLVILQDRLTATQKAFETSSQDLDKINDSIEILKRKLLKQRKEKIEIEQKVANYNKCINTVSILMLSIFGSMQNQD